MNMSLASRFAAAFLTAPLLGSVAGGIAMCLLLPGSAWMLSVMYVLFGAVFAYASTVLIGLPLVLALRNWSKPLLPWLPIVAVCTGAVIMLTFQWVLSSDCCSLGPAHGIVFSLVTAGVTGLALAKLLPTSDVSS